MSFTGNNKKRKLDCGTLYCGADANIGNNLTVQGDTTIDENLTVVGSISGGTFIPGTLLLEDGSAATPSLGFENKTSSGIYRDTATRSGIAFTTGGTKRFKISDVIAELSTPLTLGTNSIATGDITTTG